MKLQLSARVTEVFPIMQKNKTTEMEIQGFCTTVIAYSASLSESAFRFILIEVSTVCYNGCREDTRDLKQHYVIFLAKTKSGSITEYGEKRT